MTPAQFVADLDAELADSGEDIRLQRLALTNGVQSVAAEVTCRAFVRGYDPQELVGGIAQTDSHVIISPTQIVAAAWTSGRPANEDQRVPMKGNRIFIAGKARAVEAAAGEYVAGVLVRIEMRVTG